MSSEDAGTTYAWVVRWKDSREYLAKWTLHQSATHAGLHRTRRRASRRQVQGEGVEDGLGDELHRGAESWKRSV